MPIPKSYTDTGTGGNNYPIINQQLASTIITSSTLSANQNLSRVLSDRVGKIKTAKIAYAKNEIAHLKAENQKEQEYEKAQHDAYVISERRRILNEYLISLSNGLKQYCLIPDDGYAVGDMVYAMDFPDGTSVALGKVKELEPITTPGNILKNMWQYTAGQKIKGTADAQSSLAGKTEGISEVTFINSERFKKALIPVRFNYTTGLPFKKFLLKIVFSGKYNNIDIQRIYTWSSDNYYGNVNKMRLRPYQYIVIPGLDAFDIITKVTLTIIKNTTSTRTISVEEQDWPEETEETPEGATTALPSFKDDYVQIYYGKDENDFTSYQQIPQIGVVSLSSTIDQSRALDIPVTVTTDTITKDGIEYQILESINIAPVVLTGSTAKWEDIQEHKLDGAFGSEIQLNSDYIWRTEWYKYNPTQEDYQPSLIPQYWDLIPNTNSLTYSVTDGDVAEGYLFALIGADASTGQDQRIMYDYVMLRKYIISESEVNNNG